MAQVITIAGERLFAVQAQQNEPLDIDTFIFANVPGQDSAAPIDRNEGVPVAHKVHQQIVQQVGRINDNTVVYSTVLASLTGPFEFNWVGLYSSVHQTLVAIEHIPTVSKTVTVPGTAGNTLNRNFGIEYSGIADLAGITVAPETWQLDFTARLSGMDELTRQLAADMNGKDWFIEDGFKVVPRATANTFSVIAGVGYVSGLRIELKQEHILTLQTYPQFVYVDAWFNGTSSSKWSPQVAFTVTDGEMDDYIDVQGVQHYVFKLAKPSAADVVEDLRSTEGLAQKINYQKETTLAKRMTTEAAKKEFFKSGDRVFLTDVGHIFEYQVSRYIVDGSELSEMTYDDDIHILINSGGMLRFDDWNKVKKIQRTNLAKYSASIKGRTNSLAFDWYGDSIVFGQAQSDTLNAANKIGHPTSFGDNSSYQHWKYNTAAPDYLNDWLAKNLPQESVVYNCGYSGDRVLSGYLRHRKISGSDFAIVSYGINDCLFATSNGKKPDGLYIDGVYNVENYSKVLRLFAGKQILQGKAVIILGTTPFASLVGFDGSQLSAFKLSRAYNSAAKRIADELGCRYVDVNRDIFSQYGFPEITQEGTHLNPAGLKILGNRIAAALVTIESKNNVSSGSVLIANPNVTCILTKGEQNILANSQSSTPKGTLDNQPSTMFTSENWLTIPFYAESDSLVVFLNGVTNASGGQLEINLDGDALQSDYHFQRDYLKGKPAASKTLTITDKFNREVTNLSDDDGAYLHVTNRGWHSLSIRKMSGVNQVLIDSLTFDSVRSVLQNDVFGVTASCTVSDGILGSKRNIKEVLQPFNGEFSVKLASEMANNEYTIAVDTNEMLADPVAITTRYKANASFGIAFNRLKDGVWEKYAPSMFTIKVFGGR